MKKALALAEKGRYTTSPNPVVGALIVKDRMILAGGFHEKAGEPHAEIHALKKAGDTAKGATLYLTLEPCSHFGKTAPCVDAIIAAQIKRVVIAHLDLNPEVKGKGIQKLHDHGIDVTVGVLQEAAFEQNKGFFKRMETGLPWVRLKMGLTLDGKIADFKGDSKWITSEASRRDVQKWRARSDALITGVGTILKDDPELTVRDEKILRLRKRWNHALQPLLVVCDSHLKTPVQSKIFQADRMIWLAAAEKKPYPKGEVKTFALKQSKIELESVLKALGKAECNEVLVEAGSTLAGAFLEAGWVDECVFYYAPKLLGNQAKSAFTFDVLTPMSSIKQFAFYESKKFGTDWRVILRKMGV